MGSVQPTPVNHSWTSANRVWLHNDRMDVPGFARSGKLWYHHKWREIARKPALAVMASAGQTNAMPTEVSCFRFQSRKHGWKTVNLGSKRVVNPTINWTPANKTKNPHKSVSTVACSSTHTNTAHSYLKGITSHVTAEHVIQCTLNM